MPLPTDGLENIKCYYGIFVGTLKKLVSLKSQLERNILLTDDIRRLGVSANLLNVQGHRIPNKPYLLLQKIAIYSRKMIRYAKEIIVSHLSQSSN